MPSPPPKPLPFQRAPCSSISRRCQRKRFWQRVRTHSPRPASPVPAPIDGLPDVAPMLDSFQLAYNNLRELSGRSCCRRSRCSASSASPFFLRPTFACPIRSGHASLMTSPSPIAANHQSRPPALGALSPLYLAWVASHLTLIRNGTPPEKHIEELAQVFETDKPYFVSRWRWPERFNP